ncbi:MAG TPA: hypothetical protein VF037_10275 [Gemmatimonadales bacterium]
MIRHLRLALAAAAILQACADGSGTGPAFEPEEAAPGTIALTMRAEGPALDPDGYTVRVSGVDRGEVAAKGTTWIRNLPPGAAELLLGGVDDGCTVGGANPFTVAVTAGEVTRVTVAVTCGEDPVPTPG